MRTPLAITFSSLILSLASAQSRVGDLRALYASHPQPNSLASIYFSSNELQFDALLFFAYDPSSGPVPQSCFLDPLTALPRFVGPLLGVGQFPGGVTFNYVAPAGGPPLSFFAAGLDMRTLRFATTPLESLVFDVPFRHATIDSSNPTDPHCKALGDIDGDGFLDALAASSAGGDGLFWYDYKQGWKKFKIAGDNYTTDMQVADIDLDGDLDVVIPSTTLARLVWFENPRPTGDPAAGPWKVHTIGFAGAAHDVEVGDVDGDGDIDVLAREKTGSGAHLFLQNNPNSWTGVVVHRLPGEGTALGDLDGDGDLDIAQNGFWVETPADRVNGTWVIHQLATWPLDCGVAIADLNFDQRPDIIIGPSESKDGRLVWYEAPASPRTGAWTEHVIDGRVSYLHTFKVGDVDNDGDPDLVTAEMHQAPNRYVSVHFNHGGALTWSKQIIATTGSHNLRIGDIGDDGDLDIFGANWNGNSPTKGAIEYWENQIDLHRRPKLSLDRWARHVIDAQRPWQGVFVNAADVDGDGRRDILTGGQWYQNPGRVAGTWVRRDFGSPLNNLAAAYDLDGDGDIDVVGTDGKVVGNRFCWGRNDGSGRFTIVDNVGGAGDGDFLQGIAVSRFSTSATTHSQIALSWHTSTRGVQLLTVPLKPSITSWGWAQISGTSQNEALTAGDIDRDGTQDLLLGTKWLRNEGARYTPFDLHPTAGQPDRNRLADINGDGRLDAVVGFEATNAQERVAWYEQPATATGTWTEHVISRIVAPMSVDVADVDNDGDMDVIAGEHNLLEPWKGRVLIFENLDGRGLLWHEHLVHTGDEHHDGTRVCDIDGDGDLDILSIGWHNAKVLVYENLAR